ncbi:predicted protein [Naegleria gruberi]|uniref:Predicted protein n=1 Tax=Naegleria gruberi TaxID=5762 RepID=D2V6B1_NAEGR|nr:uncharacterized protein NAEGRDRAFT_64372 [Naegleria gruberi]EFC47540.1 predicted protein [Naegleria gruberi]|eukprot:XP_002680284.1 predicted protein [Naegleria gruberi strain NEG-M]
MALDPMMNRRVSSIGFKTIFYILIPNLVFLYNQTINSADYVLIYVCGFPDSFVVLYHIWRLGIGFDSFLSKVLYICYYGYALFSLNRLIHDMVNYGLDHLIAERLNGGGELRRVLENHGPLATVKSAVDTLSNMNLQQLVMHRNRLESDLKQVEEKIVSDSDSS